MEFRGSLGKGGKGGFGFYGLDLSGLSSGIKFGHCAFGMGA